MKRIALVVAMVAMAGCSKGEQKPASGAEMIITADSSQKMMMSDTTHMKMMMSDSSKMMMAPAKDKAKTKL